MMTRQDYQDMSGGYTAPHARRPAPAARTEPESLPGIDGLLVATQIAAFLPPEHHEHASTLLPR